MRIHFGTTSTTTTKMGKGKQGGEKKQNERKRRGEKEGGGDCFCIDEIWDMRTRRGQEEDCYASEDCSAHFPGPTTVIIHTSRAARRAGNVTQDRHRRDAASNSAFAGPMLGHTVARRGRGQVAMSTITALVGCREARARSRYHPHPRPRLG